MLETDLQQLETEITLYCQGRAKFIAQPTPFNFSLLSRVHNAIELLPLDSEKIGLMERFQQNVFKEIAEFHPKISYSMNFAQEIAQCKPLLEQLSLLEKQASEFYTHYFDAEKPTFDWQGLSQVRTQIHNLPNTPNKTRLMQLFEYRVLTTITQIEPKACSGLTFQPELEAEDLSLREDYKNPAYY